MYIQVLLLVAAAASAPAPVQPDVETVADLHDALYEQIARRNVSQAELRREFIAALEETCSRFAADRGIPTPGHDDSEALRKTIADHATPRLDSALGLPLPERLDALLVLAREFTSSSTAESIVSQWLGLPPPRPAPPQEPGALRLRQIDAGPLSGGDLALAPEATRVIEENGEAGGANGVIDPGEWIKVSVAIRNTSALPWFSTTAVVEPQGACAWSDPHRAVELGELSPGEEGELPIWIYVSSTCPPAEPFSVRINMRDTHPGRTPSLIQLVLSPMAIAAPRLKHAQLDADDLGSSDGSNLSDLRPNHSFEYVTDLAFPVGNVRRAAVSYQLPRDLSALFASSTMRSVEMVHVEPGVFVAGDDLDVTTVGADAFRGVIESARESRPWVDASSRGRLWVAVDVNVLALPPEPSPPPGKAPRFDLRLTGGRSRRDRAQRTPALQDPDALGGPIPSRVVENLVMRFLHLVPHKTPPELDGAVDAATGYELIFDRDGFRDAYEAMTTPKVEQPPPPVTPRPVAYRYRLYTMIPVAAVVPPVRVTHRDPEPVPPPSPVEADQVISETASVERSWLRVDVGAGASMYFVQAPALDPNLWGGADSIALPSLAARAFVGPHLSGIVGGGLALAMFEPVAGEGFVTLQQLTFEMGAGYRFEFGHGDLEATPYGLFDLGYRDIKSLASSMSTSIALGATFRYRIDKAWRAVLDASWAFGPGTPVVDRTELVAGSGPRLLLGLGLAY